MPDGLLNDMEEPATGIGLVDTDGNAVRHGDAYTS